MSTKNAATSNNNPVSWLMRWLIKHGLSRAACLGPQVWLAPICSRGSILGLRQREGQLLPKASGGPSRDSED